MNRLIVVAALFAALCASCNEAPPAPATDTREAIAVMYVRESKAPVFAAARPGAEQVSEYARGESVSVLAKKGEWTEIRVGAGSAWMHKADLADAKEASQVDADNLTPRFRVRPAPVSQPNARGTIVLEANVNTDGEVTSVRTISNTTGSMMLETKNAESLRRARFEPIVQHGVRREFVYTYKVEY